MLPDYPLIKAHLIEAVQARLNAALNSSLGTFSQAQKTTLHEGAGTFLERDDGSIDDKPMHRFEASAILHHDLTEIESLDPSAIVQTIDELGHKLGASQLQHFLSVLDTAVKSVGNVVDSKRPMVEQIFEMLEKLQLDFRPDRQPQLPQCVFGSKATEDAFNAAWERIRHEPELRGRLETLIERKRQDFDDREAARRLVD